MFSYDRPRGGRLIHHYVVYPIIIAVTLVLVTIVAGRVVRSATYETHQRDLEIMAQLVSNLGATSEISDQTVAQRIVDNAATEVDLRITIINSDGSVLADSQADPETMDNHANRPEVRRAMNGHTGTSVRRSATIGEDLIYVAVPTVGPPGGVVRVALVVDDVEERIHALYWFLIVPGVTLLAIALFATIRMSKAIRVPLRELHLAAEAYAAGEFEYQIPTGGPAELNNLIYTFMSMAGKLQRHTNELVDQRREMEEIINTIQDPLLLLDEKMRILRVNKAAETLFEIPIDALKQRMLLDVIRSSELDAFVTHIQKNEGPAETHILKYGTPERRLHVWGVHLVSSVNVLSNKTLLVLRDVTPAYRLEQIRRDFVANVSHELKTPLTMIQGAVETLSEMSMGTPEERRQFESMIATNAARMTAIVEDLLELARIERTEDVVPTERHVVKDLLDTAAKNVTDQSRENGVEVSIHCPESLEWPIHAPSLTLAVTNLLENAIRYSENNSEVIVEGACDDSELSIRVVDHGVGIPGGELDRIFERFYRVPSAAQRGVRGTGLGLSIVKHVARVHGGTVQVTSEVGVGSSFTILIPGVL